jgi:hypothetical protein
MVLVKTVFPRNSVWCAYVRKSRYIDGGGHRLTARRLVNFTIGHFNYIDKQIVLCNSYRNEVTGYLLCLELDIKVAHPVQIISLVERLLRI